MGKVYGISEEVNISSSPDNERKFLGRRDSEGEVGL